MKLVNIHEAKAKLSMLVNEALNGEEIILAKANVPLIKLVVIYNPKKRKFGTMKGKMTISDDFDDELVDFKDYIT